MGHIRFEWAAANKSKSQNRTKSSDMLTQQPPLDRLTDATIGMMSGIPQANLAVICNS